MSTLFTKTSVSLFGGSAAMYAFIRRCHAHREILTSCVVMISDELQLLWCRGNGGCIFPYQTVHW